MSEFARIAKLAARFKRAPAPAVGIGDDCAVLANATASLAVSVDAAVDGVHFTRELISLDLAAARAVEAALSDLAAMGASIASEPAGSSGILCALTLPRDFSEPEFEALLEGIARAADRAGACVLGGNLSAGPVLSITTTVLGRIPDRTLLRSGARVGDRVCVTGTPGAAALGLAALRSGRGDESMFAPFVTAWREPRARIAEGLALARYATAAIDVSDGLAQDAAHMATASACAIELDLTALPMHVDQVRSAGSLGLDAVQLALGGGEDYELLFACAHDGALDLSVIGATVIGRVVAGTGVWIVDANGRRPWSGTGFDHFA